MGYLSGNRTEGSRMNFATPNVLSFGHQKIWNRNDHPHWQNCFALKLANSSHTGHWISVVHLMVRNASNTSKTIVWECTQIANDFSCHRRGECETANFELMIFLWCIDSCVSFNYYSPYHQVTELD